MGNQRFRLSDMVPNAAWFYKLKEMVKLSAKNQHKITSNKKTHAISSSYSSLSSSSQNADNNSDELAKIQPHLSEQRKSYYFTRDLTLHPNPPPRRSSRRRRSTQRRARPHDTHPSLVSSSISAGCGCRSAVLTFSDNDGASADTIPYCGDRKTEVAGGGAPDFDHRDLPRIITKKQQSRSGVRRVSGNPSSSPGVKLRTNTPRIGNRRGRRRSVSEGFAVVKSSRDPGRDFRESMVEMIVEHDLRGTTDLEELLACYLSLNADEYHHLIIAVFKQIWFDFIRFRLN